MCWLKHFTNFYIFRNTGQLYIVTPITTVKDPFILIFVYYYTELEGTFHLAENPTLVILNLNLKGLLVTRHIDNTSPGGAPGGKLVLVDSNQGYL